MPTTLQDLSGQIIACRRCPRLRSFLAEAREQRPDYWARPVPGFGDPEARLLIIGLAPGFHGANQHGRVFTGDASGQWLWRAVYEAGLSNQRESLRGDDGLRLQGAYVNNVVRCVPPGNKPLRAELDACRPFLAEEMDLLPSVRVVLALGRIAHDGYLKARDLGEPLNRRPFSHGAVHRLPGRPVWLVDSYHPSRQNTNTGVLTWEAFTSAVGRAWELVSE